MFSERRLYLHIGPSPDKIDNHCLSWRLHAIPDLQLEKDMPESYRIGNVVADLVMESSKQVIIRCLNISLYGYKLLPGLFTEG